MSSAPLTPVLIYGAGAVGQFVGGTLALAGHQVMLLGRPALQQALAAQPLTIEQEASSGTPASSRTVSLPIYTTIDDLPVAPALVILTVKSYDTAGALPDLRRLVADGAVILTIQNGVGNEETLAEALGATTVRSGAFTISVSVPEPGRVVRHTPRGGLGFAPFAGESIEPLLALFAPTGLPLTTAPDFRALKWSKLLLNLLGNAQGAILDLPPALLFGDRRLFGVERRGFLETYAVMRAARIGLVDLPAYPVRLLTTVLRLPAVVSQRLLVRRLSGGRGAKLPSLALDLHDARGRSEVAWYNGAVVALGERTGVPTPVNALLARILTAATADPLIWAHYRGNPDRLLADLRDHRTVAAPG